MSRIGRPYLMQVCAGLALAALGAGVAPAQAPPAFAPPRLVSLPEQLPIAAAPPAGTTIEIEPFAEGAVEYEALPPGAIPSGGVPVDMRPRVMGQTGYAASGISHSGGLAPAQPWIAPQPVDPPVYPSPGGAPSAMAESRLAMPGAKQGMLQRVQFLTTWLAPGGSDGMGQTDLDLRVTLGVPVPGMFPPLLVTPGFTAHFLDGPVTPDVPAHLYDSWVEFRWLKPINERWVADLAVAPGWYSDWESSDSAALRIQGRGLGIYQWSPGVKVVLGVVYLDREDVNLLPAAGLMWEGNGGDTKVELLFPRPRIAWRFGAPGEIEYWWFVAGEFGGGTWAVRRENQTDDILTLRDYRALLGIERQVKSGISSRVEVGYVFGREIEYTVGGDTSLNDTILLRGGLVY